MGSVLASRPEEQPTDELWAHTLEYMRRHSPTLERDWFAQLRPVALSGGRLLVRAPSETTRAYLDRHCAQAFTDAARVVSGRLVQVRFLGPDDPDAPEAAGASEAGGQLPVGGHEGNGRAPASAIEPKTHRRARQLAINPDNSFENFVMGPGNRLAHAAALAVADDPGGTYNPLFVHGGVGLGKTHLLQAVCMRIADRRPSAVIEYVSCDEFTTQFMEAVQAGRMTAFRHEFREVDMLVIDDVHFLAKRDRTQEEFFHTFNVLYQTGKQIVLSSDARPEDIPHLEDRLISRFKWGLVAAVEQPDYETRIAIVRTKARMRAIALGEGVAEHVASCIDANIRELEGAIDNLRIRATVDGRPIDLELAREVLGHPRGAAPQATVSMQDVFDAVTAFYGVRLSDLQSRRKPRSIAGPRQVVMYLARRHTRHSLEEIGGYLGGRDHTTVMHGVAKIEQAVRDDPGYAQEIARVEARLTPTGR